MPGGARGALAVALDAGALLGVVHLEAHVLGGHAGRSGEDGVDAIGPFGPFPAAEIVIPLGVELDVLVVDVVGGEGLLEHGVVVVVALLEELAVFLADGCFAVVVVDGKGDLVGEDAELHEEGDGRVGVCEDVVEALELLGLGVGDVRGVQFETDVDDALLLEVFVEGRAPGDVLGGDAPALEAVGGDGEARVELVHVRGLEVFPVAGVPDAAAHVRGVAILGFSLVEVVGALVDGVLPGQSRLAGRIEALRQLVAVDILMDFRLGALHLLFEALEALSDAGLLGEDGVVFLALGVAQGRIADAAAGGALHVADEHGVVQLCPDGLGLELELPLLGEGLLVDAQGRPHGGGTAADVVRRGVLLARLVVVVGVLFDRWILEGLALLGVWLVFVGAGLLRREDAALCGVGREAGGPGRERVAGRGARLRQDARQGLIHAENGVVLAADVPGGVAVELVPLVGDALHELRGNDALAQVDGLPAVVAAHVGHSRGHAVPVVAGTGLEALLRGDVVFRRTVVDELLGVGQDVAEQLRTARAVVLQNGSGISKIESE